MPTTSGDHVVESTTEARQGVTGHGVRYVLIISVAAAVCAMAIVFLIFFR
jgi:hypothetical protein